MLYNKAFNCIYADQLGNVTKPYFFYIHILIILLFTKKISTLMRIAFIIITAFTITSCNITSKKIYDKTSYALKSIDPDPIKEKEYVLAKKYHYIKTVDSNGTGYIRTFNPDLRQINSLETFEDRSCNTRESYAWYWYDNGALREEGPYADDNKHGKWKEYYYPSGALKAEGYFKNGSKVGQWRKFDAEGWRSQTISYTPDNPFCRFTKYDSSGQVIKEGVYHQEKVAWKLFEGPNASYMEDFDVTPYLESCGDFQRMDARDSCSKNNLLIYIFENINYPAIARDLSIMGTSIFRCRIAKDGSVQDIRTLVGISKEIENECRDLLQNMPAWEAATKNGKPVEVEMTIPIKFEVQKGGIYNVSSYN